MKAILKLENPKKFPELLLFFGIVLVLLGTGIQTATANSTLTTDGWIVVAIAVCLWVLKEAKGKK